MIMKLLLIIGVITIVYFIFFKKKPQNIQSKNKTSNKPESKEMVECSSCGIYCELDDTILSNNKYYCSQECVDKG